MAPVSYTTTTNQSNILLAFNNCVENPQIKEETQVINRLPTQKRFFSDSKGYKIGGDEAPKEYSRRFKIYQIIIFGTLFMGYASYTYARKIFSYAAPTLIGLSLLSQNSMGAVNSSQYFAYAISKFVGGILSDRISPKLLFPAGLFISGMSAISVAFSSDPKCWAFLWFVNGLGQGCGWPACSKLLKKWFTSKQFGTCWSLLTSSSNVSGAIGPIIAAFCLVTYGWKTAFIISGAISVVIALAAVIMLVDDPKDVSLSLTAMEGKSEDHEDKEKPLENDTSSHQDESRYKEMLRTPLLWIISACYLIVFSTKTALSDWGQVFLMHDLGQTQMQASTFNSAIETGGFIGALVAGVVTDKLNTKISTTGNTRLLVSTLFMASCALAFHVLIFMVTPQTPQIVISLIGFVSGGALFGPISIFGIVASESFPPSISGASHAVVALAANVGAILAGWPVSELALMSGWKSVFTVFEILLVASVVIILVTRNLQKVTKTKQS